ncbi:MAG: alkaline phosphatase family protein [Gammaproteobacteria bacterium]
MIKRKVLMIGLDGYEASVGDALMAEGQLPALQALRERSACFLLDHGSAKNTGLAWEHVSSGLAPGAGGRWAAVDFDPLDYAVWQRPTTFAPFVTGTAARTVVFDAPYFDLDRTPQTQGLVAWGAHDPGVKPSSRPACLQEEFNSRFGAYPATKWIYGFVWPSAERAQLMAEALVRAAEVRSAAARWLLTERLPDWDLGIVVVSELHSATEALWHGIDPQHPLHGLPSSAPASKGLRTVYRAVDKLVGELTTAVPDAAIVLFSLHGMGANDSDIASMALLPELLYRDAFHKPYMRVGDWGTDKNGIPMLSAGQGWENEMRLAVPGLPSAPGNHMLKKIRRVAGGLARKLLPKEVTRRFSKGLVALDWMPATRYRPYWPAMRAFALPSFYDGRIRINLAGREAKGKVPLSEYTAVCDAIEALLRECRDPLTGKPVLNTIERCAGVDPLQLGTSESDLVIVWNSAPVGFVHPELGRIGPLPYRRTGGHTGKHGMAFIAGTEMESGEYGIRSSFDVVPTIIELLGELRPASLSGESMCAREPILSVSSKEGVSARG